MDQRIDDVSRSLADLTAAASREIDGVLRDLDTATTLARAVLLEAAAQRPPSEMTWSGIAEEVDVNVCVLREILRGLMSSIERVTGNCPARV